MRPEGGNPVELAVGRGQIKAKAQKGAKISEDPRLEGRKIRVEGKESGISLSVRLQGNQIH